MIVGSFSLEHFEGGFFGFFYHVCMIVLGTTQFAHLQKLFHLISL